jgi:hypothetical protein
MLNQNNPMEDQNPTPKYFTSFNSIEEILAALANGELISAPETLAPALAPIYHSGNYGTVADQAVLAREFLLELPDWTEAQFAKDILALDDAIAALVDRGEDWWEVWTKLFSSSMYTRSAGVLICWLDRAGYGSTNFSDVVNWAEGFRASLTQNNS